jgi:hypothetical protein
MPTSLWITSRLSHNGNVSYPQSIHIDIVVVASNTTVDGRTFNQSTGVDSNASADSKEILGETRNKYAEDRINLPADCANT